MIEFCNGKYTAERDKYQWVLTERYEGKDKKGNAKEHTREAYHATLDQICNEVIERECGKCDDAEEIVTLLKSAKDLLTQNIISHEGE